MQYLWLVPIIGVVTAVKLPGRNCPTVPRTHRSLLVPYQCLVYSIPFSADVPTHLFTKTENEKNTCHYKVSVNYNESEVEVAALRLRRGSLAYDPIILSKFLPPKSQSSFALQSDIVKMKREERLYCDTPIFEEARFWQDKHFLFVWSCVEGMINETDHEEALIAVNLLAVTGDVQEELRRAAKKYVGKELVALINTKEPHYSDNIAAEVIERFYTCPPSNLNHKINLAPYILTPIGVLLILVLGTYCFLLNKEEDG